MLYCIMLCCIMLYCHVVLYHAVLYHAASSCMMLQYIVLPDGGVSLYGKPVKVQVVDKLLTGGGTQGGDGVPHTHSVNVWVCTCHYENHFLTHVILPFISGSAQVITRVAS